MAVALHSRAADAKMTFADITAQAESHGYPQRVIVEEGAQMWRRKGL
jgi:hypothetical protein